MLPKCEGTLTNQMVMRSMSSLRSLHTILLVTAGIVASAPDLYSATLTVSTTSDAGSGSLRQAILDANAMPGDDTVEITATGTIVLSSPLPQITDNIVLNGPGANLLTVSGNNAVRVFIPRSGTNNVFTGINIASGLATNGANGAGIENAGDLTLMSCAVANSHTLAGLGGGIYNSGNLNLFNSMVASNSVTGGDGSGGGRGGQGGGGGGLGGGLFTSSGTVVITNSSFLANRASGGNGGGGGGSDQTGANGGGPDGGSGGAPDTNGSPGEIGRAHV